VPISPNTVFNEEESEKVLKQGQAELLIVKAAPTVANAGNEAEVNTPKFPPLKTRPPPTLANTG
jgi:hypothetical protein